MTPVQLPEVPAPSAWAMTDYQPEANTQFTMRVDAAEHYASVGLQVEPLYTADQLRAYATEAVMAERARFIHEAMKIVNARTRSRDASHIFAGLCETFTQPEQNSGR